MYGADHQTPLACRFRFLSIKILEWIRRVSQQAELSAAATRRRAS